MWWLYIYLFLFRWLNPIINTIQYYYYKVFPVVKLYRGPDKAIDYSWRRYFSLPMTGIWHVSVTQPNGDPSEIIFRGSSSLIHKVLKKLQEPAHDIFRGVNPIFLRGGDTVLVDVSRFDHYYSRVLQMEGIDIIKNLAIITSLFDIQADSVKIIRMVPFGITVSPLEDVEIDTWFS